MEERSGGELVIIDGRSSRGLGEWKGDSGCRLIWLCMGGSSMDECMWVLLASFSETLSYFRAVSCHAEPEGIFSDALQLLIPNLSRVCGCEAVQERQRL